jgi:hypothetical protein
MSLSSRPLWMLPLGRIRPIIWVPAFALILLIDYFAGPDAPFPVFYVVPVILAAWYSGQMTALWLALALPAQRFVLEFWVWGVATQSTDVALMATMIRISTNTLLALATFRLSEHERALKRDLATLQGLLPLCARCKSIRNSESHWESLESYLESRSGAQFSHGLCPSCSRSALLE